MRVVVIFSLALCACGGAADDTFQGQPTPPAAEPDDGGPPGDLTAGPDASDAAPPPASCAPASIATYTPTWTPPEPWKQGVCTAQQIDDFYAACLSPPLSPQTCAGFVKNNAACAACVQSQESAAIAAAIVWHDQSRYWTVNVAGCIARAAGDVSASGCGAAYAAAIQCRQKACDACWSEQGATFQAFAACESQAGKTGCAQYAQEVPAKCGDLKSGATAPCMPPSGATVKDAFLQVAPLFCGGP